MRFFLTFTLLSLYMTKTFALSYHERLQSITFLTEGNYTFQYQPNYTFQMLNSDNHQFNEIVYLLHRQHAKPKTHLIELNVHTGVVQIDKKSDGLTQQVLSDLLSNQFYYMNDTLGKKMMSVLAATHGITLEPLYDLAFSERLESKQNTCQAMLYLKEAYRHDARMVYYMNTFFPETGIVASVDDLKQHMNDYRNQGLVLKMDKGNSTNNVFIGTPSILEPLLTHEDPLTVICQHFQDTPDAQTLRQAIHDQSLIWQEYIEPAMNELSFQFYTDVPNHLALGAVGFNLMSRHRFFGTCFNVLSDTQLRTLISPEAFDYFERIVNALVAAKIHLALGEEQPSQAHVNKLAVTGLDILPVIHDGRLVPKISEVNPRITAGSSLAKEFFDAVSNGLFSESHIFIGVSTGFIPLNPNISASSFVETFNRVFTTVFSDFPSGIHVNLARLLIQKSFTAFEVYINFYPLLLNQEKMALTLTKTFSDALYKAFKY